MTETGVVILLPARLAIAALFCLLLLPGTPCLAQRVRPRARIRIAAPRQPIAAPQRRIQLDQHQHGPNFFRRLRELPPDQQQRVLQNDAQFHRLPPARQQQILQNLQRWNNLTPHQRQVLRQREEILQSLSPAQRQELRNVFPEYRRLNPQRQQQVMSVFRRLRNMTPAQRQRFLNSPQFQQRFTSRQQDVLRGLSGLLPG